MFDIVFNNKQLKSHIDKTENIAKIISEHNKDDFNQIRNLIKNFKIKTDDFYRDNRKLNIGVIGQVKAGKSSFLNTMLFDGEEVLPKASTPKTATLTKMEYSEENIIQIEYYTEEDWETIEDNSNVDLDDDIYVSARELVSMVQENGIDVNLLISKGKEEIHFDTYEDLISCLNNYVGQDGMYTPLVKSVTLFLNKEEFKGLSIVDTPGLNDPIISRTIRTREFMEVCDVVFFLSQGSYFLDNNDWTLLSNQLPDKGVKKLVLIASKYDNTLRNILREKDPDDIFGDDDNFTDSIPEGCKMLKTKLRRRAKVMVKKFVNELEKRNSDQQRIEVINQLSEPILVSAMCHNMSNKSVECYTKEEKNVYNALKKYAKDLNKELSLIGNIDEVRNMFSVVIKEKEEILEKRANGFVPDSLAELSNMITGFKNKVSQRLNVLNNNDREELLAQKQIIEKQINNIKYDISKVFGELLIKLEEEKIRAIKEIRDSGNEYSSINERTGTTQRTRSYTTGFWFFKKRHYYTTNETYSYVIAADAVENLKKYSVEAVNNIEKVFIESINLKDFKRKLLTVILDNFDVGNEKYDPDLFKMIVEKAINSIDFPIFNIDISKEMSEIGNKFPGEITSSKGKTDLSIALNNAILNLNNNLSQSLANKIIEFKENLNNISTNIQSSFLKNIEEEFTSLIEQCENKEKEIDSYKVYLSKLEGILKTL